MYLYQIVATSYRGEEFPDSIVYESEEEAISLMNKYMKSKQKELKDDTPYMGQPAILEKAVVRKLSVVFTKETQRRMSIDDILTE